MKWVEMLSCPVETLRTHYASVRELAYNNARIAQHGRRSAKKMANSMGYLMTQVSMCENAARKRKITLLLPVTERPVLEERPAMVTSYDEVPFDGDPDFPFDNYEF